MPSYKPYATVSIVVLVQLNQTISFPFTTSIYMFHGSAVYSRWLASLEYSIDRWLRLWQAPLVRPQADKCGWSRRCVIARRDTSTFSNGRNVQVVLSLGPWRHSRILLVTLSGKEQNLSELITFRAKVSARNCCYSSCGWRQSCQEQSV